MPGKGTDELALFAFWNREVACMHVTKINEVQFSTYTATRTGSMSGLSLPQLPEKFSQLALLSQPTGPVYNQSRAYTSTFANDFDQVAWELLLQANASQPASIKPTIPGTQYCGAEATYGTACSSASGILLHLSCRKRQLIQSRTFHTLGKYCSSITPQYCPSKVGAIFHASHAVGMPFGSAQTPVPGIVGWCMLFSLFVSDLRQCRAPESFHSH
jgi:hypothetical protein